MASSVTREPNCTGCPLHESAGHVCLMGSGPTPADLMIIGEAPGRQEDRLGAAFVGDAGHLLDDLLEKAGISRERAYVTNAVKCRPPDNRNPKPQEIKACARHLQREFDAVRPKYVLLLGGTALKSVLGETGITKARGRARYVNESVVMPSLHPASAFYAEGNRSIIQQDLHHLQSIIKRGGVLPRETNINSILVDTPDKVEEMLAALTGVVAFDIETTDLYPWDGEITAFGFGTADAQYSLLARHKESVWSPDDIDSILTRAVEKLKRCFVVGQHIKFDQLWVLVHYGLFIEADFDTMLAHYLLDENAFHDLEYLARLHFNAPAWDISLADKQGAASAEKLSYYLAHDLYYTRRLFAPLSEQLAKDRRLNKLYSHVLMPLANLFVRIEAHGACIDERHLDDAEGYLNEHIRNTQRELNQHGRINWGSTQQIAQLLYSPRHNGGLGLHCPMVTKNGAPSTAESALNMLDHPVIGLLKQHRAAKQEMSLFIKGWRPFIVPSRKDTHRLHPSFKLHGTTTGRASAEHPNLQQTTREPRVRSVITAPAGWQLMEFDLSQIELRIVAHLSKDQTMLDTFRKGQDIHWRTALREVERGGGLPELVLSTASTLTQRKVTQYGEAMQIILEAGPDAAAEIDKQWKKVRYTAKATNFGYVYGMWWRKFRIYARDEYNIEITDRQAQESRQSFFSLYSGLEKWHESVKRYVSHQGHVRGLDGQLRRLPIAQERLDSPERQEAFRQAINSPVQGFASKINFMILLQACEELPWSIFRPIATVHDAVLAEVRDDAVETTARRLLEMARHPALFDVLDISLDVPLEGEVKIGPWGSGISVDKWLKERKA